MTRPSRRIVRPALLGAGLLLFFTACITADVRYREGGEGLYADDRSGPVEVISTKIGGKNVYLPSTIVLTEGEGRMLSFFNTTDTPHGMRIPGLGIEVVLPPGQELVVALPELEGGNVYSVQCHLHPPHRGAALVVLPRR